MLNKIKLFVKKLDQKVKSYLQTSEIVHYFKKLIFDIKFSIN